jgi:hypothetical protein
MGERTVVARRRSVARRCEDWVGVVATEQHSWELWYPEAASTGLPFARGRLDSTTVLWVHAAPPALTVEVRDAAGARVARGENLRRAGERLPTTRLTLQGDRVAREDRWPTAADLGAPIILPGGEVGVLKGWWNAPDGSEWRWQVEFYNHR